MDSRDFFNKFIKDKWDNKYAYTSTWFAEHYSFTPHCARYYLNLFVYTGKLICLKIDSRNYYMKPENKERFEKYTKLKGVKIV
jgi:hypothetical protein